MSENYKDRLKEIWPHYLLEDLDNSLAYLKRQCRGMEESSQSPIFILSAGWRTGSTLIQRLINSNSNVALFGEAFEHHFLWHQLANQLKNFSALEKKYACYIPENYGVVLPEELNEMLTKAFTATLAPPISHLIKAHRSFIEILLKEPVEKVGREIWGLKLVRSNIDVAKYLQFLYPRARFIFLVRNPYDACNSCLNIIKGDAKAFPLMVDSHYISNATDYAIHWKHCVSGFLEHYNKLNAMIIKYEELRTGKATESISNFLDLTLDEDVLLNKVSVTKIHEQLTVENRMIIKNIAGEQIKALDY